MIKNLSLFHCKSTACSVGLPGSDSKESACNIGEPSSSPGSGIYPRIGNGYPLQYSCLENFMDRRDQSMMTEVKIMITFEGISG